MGNHPVSRQAFEQVTMTPSPGIKTATFLPYMRDVTACEQTLQELNLMWRLIDASAKMNCPFEAKTILSSLAAARSGFTALETALVSTLVCCRTPAASAHRSTRS